MTDRTTSDSGPTDSTGNAARLAGEAGVNLAPSDPRGISRHEFASQAPNRGERGEVEGDGPTLIWRMREWQHAVGRSDLNKGEKAVMYALLAFIDVETGGNLYPSEALIGQYTGMTADGVSRILDRLEQKGVLRFIRRGGGRNRSHRMELDFAALRGREIRPSGNSVRGSGFPVRDNSDPRALKLRSPIGDTPIRSARKPVPRSEDPSIHPSSRTFQEPSSQAEQVDLQQGDGCMGEAEPKQSQRVRELLVNAGVRGPNLDKLADANGISVAVVEEEIKRISKATDVGNRAAVLVAELSRTLGITLSRRATLSESARESVKAMEEIRRQRRNGW